MLKHLAVAALAATALVGASSAFANDGYRHGHGYGHYKQRHWNGHGHGHWQPHYRPYGVVVMPPAPVYYTPAPVYVAPQPVYVEPRSTIMFRDRNFALAIGF
jgi:hypothetical protein